MNFYEMERTLIQIDHEGRVFSNYYEITNLRKPFRTIVNKMKSKKSIKKFTLTPSETLKTNRMKSYGVHIKKNLYGFFYRVYPNKSFKCHGVYNTNLGISQKFRIKSLQNILNKQVSQKIYEQFHLYISSIFNLIQGYYPFDLILTDSPIYNIKIPIINSGWELITSIPSRNLQIKYLSMLLGKHGKIPLNRLEKELNEVDLMYTNIDFSSIEPYEKILVFSFTNNHYAGYLTHHLMKKYPEKEILPLVGFVF